MEKTGRQADGPAMSREELSNDEWARLIRVCDAMANGNPYEISGSVPYPACLRLKTAAEKAAADLRFRVWKPEEMLDESPRFYRDT